MKIEKGFSLIETMLALAVRNIIERLRVLSSLILIVITLLTFAFPRPAEARGLAISGNFYRQHFQLFPGETLRTTGVYLMVFNHEDEDIRVKLTTQTPPGVEIILDRSYFTIPPGEQQKVEVGVSISTEAVPGEYLLAIAAEFQPAEGEGITIAGAAEQRAKLTILGEAGEDHITEVVGEEVSLRANEIKDMTLIAQTCFIYGFSVVPIYHQDTGEIVFANIMYAIENIDQPLKNARVILRVSFDNELLEQTEIISLPTLDLGSTSGSYKYVPPQGWQNGTYTFRLELFSQDKVFAQSLEEEVTGTIPAPATGINWSLVGAIAGGLLVIVLIIFSRRRLNKIVLNFFAFRRLNEMMLTIFSRERVDKKAICFENPEFAGVFNEETGGLSIAKITYGVNNQHKPIPGVRVELQVHKDNTPFENITLVTSNPLEKGLINLEYDYAPEEGWQKNTPYRFKLALYIADELRTITPVNARAKSAS